MLSLGLGCHHEGPTSPEDLPLILHMFIFTLTINSALLSPAETGGFARKPLKKPVGIQPRSLHTRFIILGLIMFVKLYVLTINPLIRSTLMKRVAIDFRLICEVMSWKNKVSAYNIFPQLILNYDD